MQDQPTLLHARGDMRAPLDPAAVSRVVEDVFPEALGVWIYGSYAQGCARRDSDLDIAILPDRPIDLDLQDIVVLNLQRACQLAIDMALRIGRTRRLTLPADTAEIFKILA